MKLLIGALAKFFFGLVAVILPLFLPAGSFLYINGWLFISLLFVPMLILGTILLIKAPSLLAKRPDGRSWISLILFLHYPLVITLRIRNEEKVLTEGLNGYREYKQKVKYRLIPFIW